MRLRASRPARRLGRIVALAAAVALGALGLAAAGAGSACR
jgi:hypothetical protein